MELRLTNPADAMLTRTRVPRQDQDRWFEWAAYNLALDVSEGDIRREMVRNGFAPSDVDSLIGGLTSDAGYRAALRLARDLKQHTAINEALLQLESQVVDFAAIPRLSNLSSRDFHAQYYCANRPVIIEDVVPHWPALGKWNVEFFRKGFGHNLVSFQGGRSADHRDCFVEHRVEASFNEFLDLIERNPDDPNPPYLIAHDHLLDKLPFRKLLDDIVFDPRYFDAAAASGHVFLFMGPGGSSSPMHRDQLNVAVAQIAGHKLVRMIPARELHLMYNERGFHSEADFNNLAIEEFPLLKDAHMAEAVLNPGDMLFVPFGWWHFVKSLDLTISVSANNFCFPNKFRPIFE
jgi:hypothetical protein